MDMILKSQSISCQGKDLLAKTGGCTIALRTVRVTFFMMSNRSSGTNLEVCAVQSKALCQLVKLLLLRTFWVVVNLAYVWKCNSFMYLDIVLYIKSTLELMRFKYFRLDFSPELRADIWVRFCVPASKFQ